MFTTKIEEAQLILKDLGIGQSSQQVSALTLLALCNVKPHTDWKDAEKNSLTLTNGIMDFARKHYGIEYKPNTRESFRKLAIKPFIEYGIADLNPDDPELSPSSSNTHYAISDLALKTVRKFNTPEWSMAAENFKELSSQNTASASVRISIKTLTVKNFKSIVEDTIELGRINVFIGANGCGKTNILESLALVGASSANDLNFDGLYSRGVRIARPNLITSSFLDTEYKKSVDISMEVEVGQNLQSYSASLVPINTLDVYSKWYDLHREEEYPETVLSYLQEAVATRKDLTGDDLLKELNNLLQQHGINKRRIFDDILKEYSIYDLNTKSLRGITPIDSRKTPLGINGEGLDLIISTFNKEQLKKINKCFEYFDWLEDVLSDPNETKVSGLKAGKSLSNLYFSDRYMRPKNNIFSAENSNEGVLHVLFYFSLFTSPKTPKLIGIDNIETALNPRLCRRIIKDLVVLAKDTDKQALITTHNPAILDGLNLLDDEQRLFEVYRDDDGHTKTKRIKFKSDLSDKSSSLSNMWLSGALGAVSKHF